MEQDFRQLSTEWGETGQELGPEIWSLVLTKVVLAVVAEWVLAVPRAEGLWGNFMAVALGVEAPREAGAEGAKK
jgi:hypothetical protein